MINNKTYILRAMVLQVHFASTSVSMTFYALVLISPTVKKTVKLSIYLSTMK